MDIRNRDLAPHRTLRSKCILHAMAIPQNRSFADKQQRGAAFRTALIVDEVKRKGHKGIVVEVPHHVCHALSFEVGGRAHGY
jgi:hypothetical protein